MVYENCRANSAHLEVYVCALVQVILYVCVLGGAL